MDKAYGKLISSHLFCYLLARHLVSARLPGLDVVSHSILFTINRPGSKRSHTLRYVLRNKTTGQVYLVILFTLYLKEDVNEDGSIKPAALEAAGKASGHIAHDGDDHDEHFDEEKVIEEARRKLSTVGADDKDETNADDVD